MSDKNIADVADRLVNDVERVIAALQKHAPEFWAMSVRGYRIEAVGNLLIAAVLGVAVYLCARHVSAYFAKKEATDAEDIMAVVAGIAGGILAVVLLIATLANGSETVNKLINPEWYAAWDVIKAVKP
jgi:hypothetical protein